MSQPNLNSDDYYAILGCTRDATDDVLKKRYRKLAVKWHPDKNPDNEEATKNFQKISEAYATLSDPKKRKLYDQYGIDGVNAADQMGEDNVPSGGFGFRPTRTGGGGGMSAEDAERIFSAFFGGSDPFGGMGGMRGGMRSGMGGPGIRLNSFGSRGGADPVMMFSSGGMGGMSGLHPGFGGGGGGSMGGFGDMGRSSYAEGPKRYDTIPPGTVVSLKDLVSASDRNGDRGVVKRYIQSSGRYVVELEDSDETMSVKPSNMLQHVHVRIHGIESQPQMNGKTGTVIAWNARNERYSIYVMALKKVVSLRPGNVVLDTDTVGQVTGLTSKPELNGKWGTIKEWIRDSNKYDVQLSADKIIRIKVENMRL